ncbi:NLRP3 protein, partial [Polypterus senegalus]
MERLREDLSSVLEELRTQELKRFVFRVESAEWRHQCAHIPKGLFEKAGNEIWEIVHLMIGYYGEKTKDVALDALEAIGRRDLVKSFEDYIKEYREEIKRKYEHIHKDTFLPEERVAFNSQYTNLTFIKKRQKLDEKEEELKARGDDLVSLMKKHRKYNITINEIFSIFENDDDKREPRTVVIQGPAGIGKTFTVHKIMLDWASGELFQDRFDFVFHLCCRELRISDHESLQELIIKCSPILEEALEEILLNPERILFIFDGLDELAFSEVTARDESAVKFLLTRKILPQASVLITTRPTALSVLKGKIDRYIEIVGFLEDGIMDYFLKSFKDQEKALTAFNVIKGNTVVLSMCFVPMVCWIICSMMKENEEDREDLLKNVTNASQILLHFINTLLEHHLSVSGNSDFLQNVCRLAYHGICEKKTMFKEDELSKFFITTTGSESTFFSKTLFKRHLHVKAMYHFLHLSIQELLAALYCASKASNEETEKLLNDSLSLEQGNLIHVVRFLFGLANETSQEIIEDLDIISLSIEKTTLQSWFSRAITQYKEKYSKTSDQASNHFLLQLLYCLFEMQDAEFATQAMKEIPWIDLSGCLLNRVDCTVIKYCIECSEHIQNLDVYRCNLDDVTVKILCEILPKCLSINYFGPINTPFVWAAACIFMIFDLLALILRPIWFPVEDGHHFLQFHFIFFEQDDSSAKSILITY